MLAIARTIYAEEWASNASAYQAQGLYEMLAEHVAQAGELRVVLDVGCGQGQGVAALRAALPVTSHVIGVDQAGELKGPADSLKSPTSRHSDRRKRLWRCRCVNE